jgi:hypothetical protein
MESQREKAILQATLRALFLSFFLAPCGAVLILLLEKNCLLSDYKSTSLQSSHNF